MPFICKEPGCNALDCGNVGLLVKHRRDVHGIVAKRKKKCPDCKEKFPSTQALNKHVCPAAPEEEELAEAEVDEESQLLADSTALFLNTTCDVRAKETVLRYLFERFVEREQESPTDSGGNEDSE